MQVTTQKFQIPKGYIAYPIEYMKEHFCIHLEMKIGDKSMRQRFLVDLGFQKEIILDHSLLAENGVSIGDFKILYTETFLNS